MQHARKRATWVQLPTHQHRNVKKLRAEDEVGAAPSRPEDGEKITVAIDPKLLECGVCFGPLKSPIFQYTKGHISCSECCTFGAMHHECLMCREPETATRCRAMERVLDGLSVPCAFRQNGCTEMIPYAEKQDHAASCAHAPRHCPIAGCDGYNNGGSLLGHIELDHPDVRRTHVTSDFLNALGMREGEDARVLWLGNGRAQFLLVVGRGVPSGRTLSVIHLVEEPLDEEEDFEYTVKVAGEATVLSLCDRAEGVKRLTKPYQANVFLFVPNAIWDAAPDDLEVFIELKSLK